MRRMFRRQIRKALAQDVPPILQEANFAFSKGEYGRAAELYEQIARIADGRGGPRASLFHLQAGRSRVLAGQTALGMPSIKRGLELYVQRGEFQKFHRFATQMVFELYQHGLKTEAAEIETWLKSAMPKLPVVDAPAKRPALPTHCPSCGAPLRQDEAEWLDEVTAGCGYCGSPVRDEK